MRVRSEVRRDYDWSGVQVQVRASVRADRVAVGSASFWVLGPGCEGCWRSSKSRVAGRHDVPWRTSNVRDHQFMILCSA